MPRYAQLNGDICFAETYSSGPLVGPDLIELDESAPSVRDMRHIGGGVFEPVEVPPIRHVSVGSFFDRFGAAKWAILADTDPSVRAVVQDASVRKYIDLDNPQLPAGLAIVAARHTIDTAAILSDPILESERP